MVLAVATHPPVGAQGTCALNPFLSSAIVKFMDQEWECGQTLPKVQEKEGNLITKWQIDRGKTRPRLISNWLKVPQPRETKNES